MRQLENTARQTTLDRDLAPHGFEIACTICTDDGLQRGMSLIHRTLAEQSRLLASPAPAVDILSHRAPRLSIAIRGWCGAEDAGVLPLMLKEQLQGTFKRNRMRIEFR